MLTNKSVFNMNIEEIDFLSNVAGELKELFDLKFSHYKGQLRKMEDIAPKTIQSSLE